MFQKGCNSMLPSCPDTEDLPSFARQNFNLKSSRMNETNHSTHVDLLSNPRCRSKGNCQVGEHLAITPCFACWNPCARRSVSPTSEKRLQPRCRALAAVGEAFILLGPWPIITLDCCMFLKPRLLLTFSLKNERGRVLKWLLEERKGEL